MNLTVLETADEQKPPNGQLIPHLQNTTLYVPLNGDLNLTCCTYSDNEPIEWWFQQSSGTPWVKLSNNSKEYHIRSSIEEYEGYYTCDTIYGNQVRRGFLSKFLSLFLLRRLKRNHFFIDIPRHCD